MKRFIALRKNNKNLEFFYIEIRAFTGTIVTFGLIVGSDYRKQH